MENNEPNNNDNGGFYDIDIESPEREMDIEDNDLDGQMMDLIKNCYNNILELFQCRNGTELINKLKQLDYDSGSVCARKMIKIGGWKCSDCEKNGNAILCQQCWSKVREKHLDHEILFNATTNGTCDCGDPNTLESSLFCPQHKGPLTKEEDIQKYIIKNFSQDLIQKFEKNIEDFYDKFVPYLVKVIENKQISFGFRNNMMFYVELINVLSNNNAIVHILSKIFLKNYKYKTKHYCLLIKDNEMELIKNKEEHDCCCPLIRILMETWGDQNQDVLYKFLLNYKLRKSMGVLYFLLNERFMKYFIRDFGEISVQYIFLDVSATTTSIPGLIELYYEKIYEIVKYFTDDVLIINEENESPLSKKIISQKDEEEDFFFARKEKTKDLKNIFQRVFYDNIYLIKPESANNLSNNLNLYKTLIDILSIFHNINHITAYYPHKYGLYKDSFDENLVNAENYLLLHFDLYISILNFENKEMIQKLFEYFSDIVTSKRTKQLKDDEFSFHCTLYRGFAIFLNKYCFHYIDSINSEDINDAFSNCIKYIKNFKQFGEIILKDIFKTFGFMNACGENFLNYYGENMPYYDNYYCEQDEFILRDFFLLRFILSYKDFKNSFSIVNIFKNSCLENTYNIMEKHFFSKESVPPEINFFEIEDNYKYMKFNGKILQLILNMIRDNKSLIWEFCCSNQYLKNSKIPNKLLEKVINGDKENIKENCKKLIINNILSKENLNTYTDISEALSTSIKDILGKDELEKLILSLTNKTLTINKKAKFSIKDEYFKYLDISSVYDFREKSNIQKYINNFKTEIISIYNTCFYPFTKYEIVSQNNIYNNFFLHQENFDTIFKLTEALLTNKCYIIFQQFFLTELINYWNIFFYVFEENNKNNKEYISFIDKNKVCIEKLINILSNNTLNDKPLQDYCLSVVERITKINLFVKFKVNYQKDIKSEKVNQIKSKKVSMKEKFKNKFKNQLGKIEKIYNVDSVKEEEKKIYDACIFCLKPIEQHNVLNLYGKVGILVKDLLFWNSFRQTIQKEYEKNINNKDFKDKIMFHKKTLGFNIYSCNHLMHNSCFMKLVENKSNEKCPLCRQNVDLFIPCLTQYTNEDFYYILKGYILCEKTKQVITIDDIMDDNKFTILLSEEEINNIKQFKELIENKDTKIYELIKFSKAYLYVFIQDFGIDPNEENNKCIQTDKIIERCSEDFGNFFDFIENYDDKNNLIDNWKNLILIIRLLMKLDDLDYYTAFRILTKLLKQLNSFENPNFAEMMLEDNLKKILFKILFLICILFDYESINGYEKYIMKLFLPLYSVQYFIRQISFNDKLQFCFENNYNESNFNQYIASNKNILNVLKYITKNIMLTNLLIRYNDDIQKNIINNENISFELNQMLEKIGFSNYISKPYSEIISDLDSKDNLNNINLYFEQFLYNKKITDILKDDYMKLMNDYLKDKQILNTYNPSNLLGSCLSISYNFIIFPKYALDFQYLFFEYPCLYCNRIGYPSLVCLTCGKKICKEPCAVYKPIVEHNLRCGGGRSIFIDTANYKVVLIDNKFINELDIPFYVNKFGESNDSNVTTKEIKLNEDEVNKALKIFVNFSRTKFK